ncbi:MAG: HAMP domain-containing histidine kinase [Acidobacteria bacterium]|nr:HAMP domain-containing histidine kinase [Acidobacteriota bacterium]MCA1619594.1 HAMP domain-containing histidine kinase [Acidobacteriota bacterium]
MISRSKTGLPRGWRLPALAAVAVVLPALLLSVMQYRSLAELREKTRYAAQEGLRQSLQRVRRGVEESLARAADDALAPLNPEILTPEGDRELEAHFAEVRRRHPAVEKVFLVSHCSYHAGDFALISSPEGVRRIAGRGLEERHEVRHVRTAYNMARLAPAAQEATRGYVFWQEGCSGGCTNGTASSLVYVFRSLPGGGQQSPSGFAGLALNADYVRENFFMEFAGPAAGGGAERGAGDGTDLSVGVFDEAGRELAASAGGGGYEVRAPLSPALPKWTAAAGHRGRTVESLAADNFRESIALLALVLCCLALGLTLILRSAAREERLSHAKSAFVSNVSHELKTPLALIRLFAETLELGRVKDPEKAREYYRIINHESGRLTQLINHILDFSKIEAGAKDYAFARGDLGAVIRQVVTTYEFQLERAGFELRVEVGRDLPEAVFDRDAFSQALLNLIDNAVKYSPERKSITVRAYPSHSNGEVVIEVADEGIGIPRPEQEKIFEKFYRVAAGAVHDTRGSGLGLAIVRHIAEAHRGRVSVESAPGNGSRFRIHIPARAPAATDPERGRAKGYEVA